MTVRPVTEAELQQANDIKTIAFTKQRPADQRHPPIPEGYNPYRGLFLPDGRMTATLTLHSFLSHFDGQTARMGGVGAVAVLPEYRHMGQMRTLLTATIREMHESGWAFSSLYPFSAPYYRQYGYEHCVDRWVWVIPLDQLDAYRTKGSLTQYLPGQPEEDLRNLYEQFALPLNLSVLRGDAQWKFLQADPYETRLYTYLWRDEAGTPGSYIAFHAKEEDGETLADVRDMAYTTPDSLHGLLALFRSLQGQYKKLRWYAPPFLDLAAMVPEVYRVSASAAGNRALMVRVTHVEQALMKMRKPEGKGRVAIAVHDPQLAENTGTFLVSYEEGKSHVRRDASAQPDLSLPIHALAPLITGAWSMETLLYACKGVTLHGNAALLDRLFAPKRRYMGEFF